ncbi:hypothetical protein B0O99DRAFT_685078 [Bisporella sp. PMI_857]|nr:hypothetical protein B0O99DRAFT_685078 [Bisporella sp. PMI_857]
MFSSSVVKSAIRQINATVYSNFEGTPVENTMSEFVVELMNEERDRAAAILLLEQAIWERSMRQNIRDWLVMVLIALLLFWGQELVQATFFGTVEEVVVVQEEKEEEEEEEDVVEDSGENRLVLDVKICINSEEVDMESDDEGLETAGSTLAGDSWDET